MKKIDYKLEKIADKIYNLIIPDRYDMCMTFCRVQEFYESAFKEIRGKNFTLLELMDIYSRRLGGGCFTYPIDWGGFNVPSTVINDCYKNEIKDLNYYDSIIIETNKSIPDTTYYLIGTTGNDLDALNHEIVHGYYHVNEKYRKEVISIIKEISARSYNDMKMCLLNMGYTNKVVDDEINAYLTSGTGALWEGIKITKKLEGIAKKLRLLFGQYEEINNKGI
jgi:hypothetical protein